MRRLVTFHTILKEADLFCPNSVRINFTIYQTYSFLDSCRLLPPQIYFWKPFTKTTIYVDTAQRSLLYHVDLYDMTISIFAGDRRSELSENFLPVQTIDLNSAQTKMLKSYEYVENVTH